MDTTFCPIAGHHVEASECAEITLSVTVDTAGTCAACQRKPQAKQEPLSAWDRISQATGLDTRTDVAKKLGCDPYFFAKQVARLDAGYIPRKDNKVIPALLDLTGLRLCDFIPGAPDSANIINAQAQAAPPAPETPPAAPEAATQGADPASAFGPLDEQEGEHAAELLDATGAPVQVPVGDLAHDLASPDKRGELSPVRVVIVEEDEPDDWQEYTGVIPAPVTSPKLTLDKRGRFGITACGVREFGINAPYVQPLWSASRKQIGLRFHDQPGQGVLKCSRSDKHLLHFHSVGFLRQFGITLAPGQYPLHREASGLLVATIETMPQAGGEA